MAEVIISPYNTFTNDVYKQINGNLTFDNLDRQLVTMEVKIDGTGKVLNKPQIKLTLASKITGIKVINARNSNDTNTYPLSCPFISYDINEKLVTIKNVTGLQPSSQYQLTLEILGS